MGYFWVVTPWIAFSGLLMLLLTLDLMVFRRARQAASLRESLAWTVFWVALAAIFNVVIWISRGPEPGINFLTGYLVEWSLSMDNVFVFAVIFRYFQVPPQFQYRVLFWGILGAIVMRLAFIVLGAALLRRFDVLACAFGGLLIFAAVRLALQGDTPVDPERNILLRGARRWLPVARQEHGPRFFAREEGRLVITPLLLVLLVIESTDLLFAVDSVPAILGVTKDVFIVFTSNVFAILGLRALYFLLAAAVRSLRFLNYGICAVLAFIGVKMIAEYGLARGPRPLVPSWVSLLVVAGLIGVSVLASIVHVHRPD
jgi:tellurite resistance protein TerC